MAWPFREFIRPLIRLVSWYMGRGDTPEMAAERAEAPPNFLPGDAVREAIPEARRAEYFRNFLRARSGAQSFGRAWFAAARGAWYYAYGRAPTPSEREWAFTRPEGMLGLYVNVVGQGAWSGQEQERTIKVNAAWSSSWQDVQQAVIDAVTSMAITLLVVGSEPLQAGSVEASIERGALLEFTDALLTV